MKSAVAVTQELDDADLAARELAAAITDKLVPARHSLGILFCDADLDGAAVTGQLKALLGMEIIGMTTLAEFAPAGRLELSAVLTVLSGDDCSFSAAASEELGSGGQEQKITSLYREILPADPTSGGLVMAFCPCGMPFAGDAYADLLSSLAPAVPLLGGVASDDYDYERARVFLSGREYKDSMVAVGIFGQVRPVFAMRHVTSRFAERIRRVTRAEGNVVYQVGDESFVDYLRGFGLNTEVPDPLLAFTSYPMMLSRKESDETPLMRHIASLNPVDGSGVFLGNVPVGAQANICLISKENLAEACRESMQSLLRAASEQSAATGYEYSAIFCISCCGRAIILGREADAEGRILTELLPEGLSLAGAYCLGELCPTQWEEGRVCNRFHNCSITFCML